MTFPLNLYSINSILPHLSLIFQNKFFFYQGLHIFSFFLFFYLMNLVTGFANVTSFKLKIMTLISTSMVPLNLFMRSFSLSHDTFIIIPTIYSFISYRISIIHRDLITSILCFFLLFTGVYT